MTSLLVDTQVLVWAALSPDRLSPEATKLILDSRVSLLASSVSIAEMHIKMAIGKLSLPGSPIELCRRLGADQLTLTWSHAARLSSLPLLHRDPFDRLLIAQALDDDLNLLSADANISGYPDVRVIW